MSGRVWRKYLVSTRVSKRLKFPILSANLPGGPIILQKTSDLINSALPIELLFEILFIRINLLVSGKGYQALLRLCFGLRTTALKSNLPLVEKQPMTA